MGTACGKQPKLNSKNIQEPEGPVAPKEINLFQNRKLIHKRWSELLEAEIISEAIRVDSPYGSSTALENIQLNFKFGEILGEGSVGTVKQARLISYPKMSYAVKIIKKVRDNDRNFKYFKTEVDMLKELEHPNIVKFFECYHDTDNHYTVLELCEGPSLVKLVEKTKGLPESLAKTYAHKALLALNYLHHMEMAHRDIKLDNFMLTSKDIEVSDLRLIDFGLSNDFKECTLKSRVGTPWYLAPELLSKTENYTQACDLWSLGVMIYMMIAADQPFKGRNNQEIYNSILTDNVKFDHKKFSTISPDCLQLISSLLEKDPKKRLTASFALQSAWFSPIVQQIHKNWSSSTARFVVDKLRRFKPFNPFKKEIVKIMIKTFQDAKEISELGAMFSCSNYLNHGVISPFEFQQLCKEAGLAMTLEEATKSIETVNFPNEKVISFGGFIAACLDYSFFTDKSRLKVIFDRIDTESRGIIKEDTLKNSFKRFGYRLNSQTVKGFLQEFKVAADRGMTFDMFHQGMVHLD